MLPTPRVREEEKEQQGGLPIGATAPAGGEPSSIFPPATAGLTFRLSLLFLALGGVGLLVVFRSSSSSLETLKLSLRTFRSEREKDFNSRPFSTFADVGQPRYSGAGGGAQSSQWGRDRYNRHSSKDGLLGEKDGLMLDDGGMMGGVDDGGCSQGGMLGEFNFGDVESAGVKAPL